MHVSLVRLPVPLLSRTEELMEQTGWEMQQVCEERERASIEALNRCIAAGADSETIRTLARECGVDIKFLKLNGDQHAPHE